MNPPADLELGLHRFDAENYSVEFRFSLPDSDTEVRVGQAQPALFQFDHSKLLSQANVPDEYGKSLAQALFADPAIKSAFDQARSVAQSNDHPLRIRLLIGPSAPELHSLKWETLRDPQDNNLLFAGENLLFSRYLSSLDWRPVRLRPKSELSALIAVANPSDLGEYDLAAVDVARELDRARLAFKEIAITVLPDQGRQVTLENILAELRNNNADLLYLVAHGLLVRDEPWLFLEDEQGKTARISGSDLATRLKELQQRPRLVVLASCQSAADRGAGALSALGPRLAEAGVAAVIAMQDKVSMETITKFMPTFFAELRDDGVIDRAMSVARGTVRNQPDFWMPALFMRLRSGRIWYVPGVGGDRKPFEKMPELIRSIRNNQCTPILGPGLYEDMIGSYRDIARRWAETYHYPMAPHERESLPQVAQYLAINQGPLFPLYELSEYLCRDLRQRYSEQLPPEVLQLDSSLDSIISAIGTERRKTHPYEPYKLLSQLPISIYITTNLNNLMASALEEAGKDPQIVLCPWNEYLERTDNIFTREPGYRPSPARPLVYHLYGRLDDPQSVVLTEDDYFNFLIGVTSNKALIPPVIRAALVNSALLFIGFQMDEWNFRVLFRTILALQGGSRRNLYAHIAAQIEPEEGRILEPERARRYLETYIAKGADISLYWGSPEDFVKELLPRWQGGS